MDSIFFFFFFYMSAAYRFRSSTFLRDLLSERIRIFENGCLQIGEKFLLEIFQYGNDNNH